MVAAFYKRKMNAYKTFKAHTRKLIYTLLLFIVPFSIQAQGFQKTIWNQTGTGQISHINGEIVEVDLKSGKEIRTWLSLAELTPKGQSSPLKVAQFSFSQDQQKVLLFTNSQRVWRYYTRGDYWVYDLQLKKLQRLGKSLLPQSLMYAKFSPNGNQVAFVSVNNLYVENLNSEEIIQLTFDGDTLQNKINGTFDWAYEEEFGTRDGFRWSPNSSQLAYWKIDGSKIKNYLMLNTTAGIYSHTIPVEYPKVGEDPSGASIWVVDLGDFQNKKMDIPGDPEQHYLTRMEWTENGEQLIVQQLNRKQNHSLLYVCQVSSGNSTVIFQEKDDAWVDVKGRWNQGDPSGWDWIKQGEEFVWVSEKEGWRQLYRITLQGKERKVTKDEFDVISIDYIDRKGEKIYFSASPENATQKYLYVIDFNGGKATRLSPLNQPGTHQYTLSPVAGIAQHTYSSVARSVINELISFPEHKVIREGESHNADPQKVPEFFQITTIDGVKMDGWMIKPVNFDPNKKYPVLFYVYGEPASQTVVDRFGVGGNRNYKGDLTEDGYLYISLENRGSPAPKGREWRKSIYRKIGIQNTRDQAMGAKEILKWPFVDSTRVAVWGLAVEGLLL